MRAAWYESQGPASEVLAVGEMEDLEPAQGEVRIRVACSGVHPGDVKKRGDTFGSGLPYRRVIPHSDGAGRVDAVGPGVDSSWVGRRAWCFGAQSYRPFGTAAEQAVVPVERVAALAEGVPLEEAASIGIPGITAHRAVDVAGPLEGKTVLVQGAAGAVGSCAAYLARRRGARVLATIRKPEQRGAAERAGAEEVLLAGEGLEACLRELVPQGIDHVVEVAFAANLELDLAVLRNGGSIATYATNAAMPEIPFWPLVFQNIRIDFLGSDDFPSQAKARAAQEISAALAEGWRPFGSFDRYSLEDIAAAHEQVEKGQLEGKVVVEVGG
ncbi:MAG: NADPH:quinone reductase [Acidobacteriota bacterium]